jgi:hypothetical protein
MNAQLSSVAVIEFTVDVPLMTVKDSSLIQQLDYYLHNIDTCEWSEENKADLVYFVFFDPDSYILNELDIIGSFDVNIGLYRSNVFGDPRVGVLYYNGTKYGIAGDISNYFFEETNEKETIVYKGSYIFRKGETRFDGCLSMCPLIAPQEYCEWFFRFENNKLKLKLSGGANHVNGVVSENKEKK